LKVFESCKAQFYWFLQFLTSLSKLLKVYCSNATIFSKSCSPNFKKRKFEKNLFIFMIHYFFLSQQLAIFFNFVLYQSSKILTYSKFSWYCQKSLIVSFFALSEWWDATVNMWNQKWTCYKWCRSCRHWFNQESVLACS